MTARRHAFTLIEMVLAMAACALILSALYGVFSKAMHLRDDASEHTRAARVRARATTILRNDLRHARISGLAEKALAASLEGSETGHSSSFPGYLKITTTTAPDNLDAPAADLQQVEYYLVNDPDATDRKSGLLVRAVAADLLATVSETPREEPLLAGIESMEVSFYDGQSWENSWAVTADDDKSAGVALPTAIRVRLQPAPPEGQRTPVPPIEIYVPWTTQAAIEPATPTPNPAP